LLVEGRRQDAGVGGHVAVLEITLPGRHGHLAELLRQPFHRRQLAHHELGLSIEAGGLQRVAPGGAESSCARVCRLYVSSRSRRLAVGQCYPAMRVSRARADSPDKARSPPYPRLAWRPGPLVSALNPPCPAAATPPFLQLLRI